MTLFFLFLNSAIFTRMNRDRMTLWQHCCHLQLQLVNIKKYLPDSFLLSSLIAFMVYLKWTEEWGAFRLSVAMYLQIWLQSRNEKCYQLFSRKYRRLCFCGCWFFSLSRKVAPLKMLGFIANVFVRLWLIDIFLISIVILPLTTPYFDFCFISSQ